MASEQLETAWRAVSERLVEEGYPKTTVATTMLKIALASLTESCGYAETGPLVIAAMRDLSAIEFSRMAEAA